MFKFSKKHDREVVSDTTCKIDDAGIQLLFEEASMFSFDEQECAGCIQVVCMKKDEKWESYEFYATPGSNSFHALVWRLEEIYKEVLEKQEA